MGGCLLDNNTVKNTVLNRRRYLCNDIVLNILDKAGNYLGTGIGIVFVLLGRRIVHEKPGVSGRGTNPESVVHRARK